MNIKKHIKTWNAWRKRNGNRKIYKILVLFGIAKSPTMTIERWNHEHDK